MDVLTFAIEQDDFTGDYQSLHKIGCRDLCDAEPVTIDAPTRETVLETLKGFAFDDFTWSEIMDRAKPCILRSFKSVPE